MDCRSKPPHSQIDAHSGQESEGSERLIELFKPFTTENWQVYRADALATHGVDEPAFRFEPRSSTGFPTGRMYTCRACEGGAFRRWRANRLSGCARPTR